MPGQYRSIQGVKYERDLLEFAEAATANGRTLTKKDAEDIWQQAMDGNKVTPTERRTVEYIAANFKIHAAAKELFEARLRGDADGGAIKRTSSGYYKTIDGIQYDRKLLEEAESLAAAHDGLTLKDAVWLWGKANDGKGVTATERRTLERVAHQLKLEPGAGEVFEQMLGVQIRPQLTDGARADSQKAIQDGTSSGWNFFKAMWNRFTGQTGEPQPSQICDAPPAGERSQPSQGEEPEAKRRRMAGPGAADAQTPNREGAGFRAADALADVAPAAAASTGAASGPSAGVSSSGLVDALPPELRQLLSELSDGRPLAIEAPAPPSPAVDAELAAQRAAAAAEVQRILEARSAAAVLGGGSKEEQRREFKRIALLLHPDKGLVDRDDERAGLAMRLAMAAQAKCRRDA